MADGQTGEGVDAGRVGQGGIVDSGGFRVQTDVRRGDDAAARVHHDPGQSRAIDLRGQGKNKKYDHRKQTTHEILLVINSRGRSTGARAERHWWTNGSAWVRVALGYAVYTQSGRL